MNGWSQGHFHSSNIWQNFPFTWTFWSCVSKNSKKFHVFLKFGWNLDAQILKICGSDSGGGWGGPAVTSVSKRQLHKKMQNELLCTFFNLPPPSLSNSDNWKCNKSKQSLGLSLLKATSYGISGFCGCWYHGRSHFGLYISIDHLLLGSYRGHMPRFRLKYQKLNEILRFENFEITRFFPFIDKWKLA